MVNNDNTKPENRELTAAGSWSQETVDKIVESLQHKPGALLCILHAIQREIGFIPEAVKATLAITLNLSLAEIHGVISFYSYFRCAAAGDTVIQVCRAESCQAMGSRKLEAHIKQTLNIDYHETRKDKLFTLLPVYCLGNCARSPSVRINDDIYGDVDSERFDVLLDGLTTQAVKVK